MSYTGIVTPGGPADTLTFEKLTIEKLSVSSMHNNVYILTCAATGEQLLIDAADDAARLRRALADHGSRCTTIVTTHHHHDHVRALVELTEALPQAVHISSAVDGAQLPVAPDHTVSEGDQINVGQVRLHVHTFSGHTPCGIGLAYRPDQGPRHIFVGDSLFPGGVGKTANATDFAQLLHDVETKLFAPYDDETVIHPGHGADTTLGAERHALPQWRTRGY